MLFRRRDGLSWWKVFIGWLWPRSGWWRAIQYIFLRVARLQGSTHHIAAGFAAGVAVSFTPFLGLHFLLGFALAWLTRGHLLASAIGTVVGNPWTFPLIFALTGRIGALFLDDAVVHNIPVWSWEALFDAPVIYLSAFLPLVFPLIVGGIPVAIFAWIIVYFPLRSVLRQFRARREEKLMQRRQLMQNGESKI